MRLRAKRRSAFEESSRHAMRAFPKPGANLGAPQLEQRPRDPLRPERPHAGQPGRARPPEQAEEHRFGLIVQGVARRHAVHHPRAQQFEIELPPRLARRLFQVPPARGHIHTAQFAFQTRLLRHPLHEHGIRARLFAAQTVVQMQHAQTQIPARPEFQEHLQQAHRIRPARHRHTHAAPGREHSMTLNPLGDALDQGLLRHSHCKARDHRGYESESVPYGDSSTWESEAVWPAE